jgi:hypothetical protein
LAGPSLVGLIGAAMIGGQAERQVLKPFGFTTVPDGRAGAHRRPVD